MTQKEKDSIFQNETFLARFLQELNKGEDWLLNYEYKPVPVGDEGLTGTVHSESFDKILTPRIMVGPEGKLINYGDEARDIAISDDKGYGIKFESEDEATEFSILLSLLHQLSGEEEVSYDIQGILDRLKSNGNK